MNEAEARVKIEAKGETNGYAIIKKIHIVLVLSVMVITNLTYIIYREIKTSNAIENHNERLNKLEANSDMVKETKMNLQEFLTANGYKWIKIPE